MAKLFSDPALSVKKGCLPRWEAAPLLCSLVLHGMRGSAWKSWVAWLRLERRLSSLLRTYSIWEARRMFPPRLRRGTRHPDAPLPPCFAAEERPCDTLRAHPENTARHLGEPSVHAEGRCRPKVTSGCPKRSEGGCPCRNEDEHRPSSRATYINEERSVRIT